MSHPDPNGAPDRRPIKVGEVWENPVTGERSVILERPWDNPASRVPGELTALVGARVMGEHLPSCSCRAIHRAGGGVPRQNSGRVLSFTPLTKLQASAQAVDFKVGRHFGEGQGFLGSFGSPVDSTPSLPSLLERQLMTLNNFRAFGL